MTNRAVSVLEVVQAVQAAIARDFDREKKDGNNILVVEKVEIELKTALTEKMGGKWEWKVITGKSSRWKGTIPRRRSRLFPCHGTVTSRR